MKVWNVVMQAAAKCQNKALKIVSPFNIQEIISAAYLWLEGVTFFTSKFRQCSSQGKIHHHRHTYPDRAYTNTN
jgi:hypothetical protein